MSLEGGGQIQDWARGDAHLRRCLDGSSAAGSSEGRMALQGVLSCGERAGPWCLHAGPSWHVGLPNLGNEVGGADNHLPGR